MLHYDNTWLLLSKSSHWTCDITGRRVGSSGSQGPLGRGGCPHMPAHTCVHVGKGGGPGMMHSHRQAPLHIQENCWLWGARGHRPLAMQQLPSPSDSSAVAAVALLFGQARLIWQSTALIYSWAGSSHGPEMTVSQRQPGLAARDHMALLCGSCCPAI